MAKVSIVVALGKKVPDFGLESTAGAWRLKDAAGQALVVYFYPKDETAGCTAQACGACSSLRFATVFGTSSARSPGT